MNPNILSLMTWEDLKEISDKIEEVYGERLFEDGFMMDEYFYREVLANLRKEHNCKPPSVERYDFLIHAAESATGWELTEERNAVNTIIRCFVAHRMRVEGYTFGEIAHLMNRDHSSIIYLVRKMVGMLSVPSSYKKELSMFREFNRLCATAD